MSLNHLSVEGVKTQTCQNQAANDLKPGVMPRIGFKKMRYAEIAKQQNKNITQKNPDG
jgi:hypothetical protein